MFEYSSQCAASQQYQQQQREQCAVRDDYEASFNQSNERAKTVRRVAEARLPTQLFGEFRLLGYCSLTSSEEFIVLTKGEIEREKGAVLARIHSQCLTGDVFGSIKCDCGQQLEAAMRRISEENCGVIIYQQQEGRGIGIINKIRAYALQDKGADTIEANQELGFDVDLRRYEQCAEILCDLGLKSVRLMTNNPEKLLAVKKAGLEIIERVQLEIEPYEAFSGYLKTKKERMGHLIG